MGVLLRSDRSRTAGPVSRRCVRRSRWLVFATVASFAGSLGGAGSAAAETVARGPEVPATATNLLHKVASNTPMFAVHPTRPEVVAMANRVDFPAFSCALQMSGDGGRSWVPAQPVSKLPADIEKCYGPEVAFGQDGRLYYLFVGLKGSGNRPAGAFLTSSSDLGRKWSTPRRVLGPLRFQVRMALDRQSGDQGRIHLVWLESRADPPLGGFPPVPNPIMSAYSDDGGRRFSKPVQVSDPDRLRAVTPALALGADNRVHVAYYDFGDDARDYQGLEGPRWEEPWSVVLATSVDGGRSFTAGQVVEKGVVPPERVMLVYTMPPPSLVADGKHVYLSWHDARNTDWDAFLRASEDGGRTWSRAKRLNDDALSNGYHQYLPRLSVSPGGRLDAVFYDRRTSTKNALNDVYYTFSTDHGATFSRNLRLTTFSSNPKSGPQYANESAKGLFEFGSRLGLLSGRSAAVAAWTDTRNSDLVPPSHDIYTTRIAVEGGDRGGTSPVIAVLAGTVGVGAVAVVVRRRRRRGRIALTASDATAESVS